MPQLPCEGVWRVRPAPLSWAESTAPADGPSYPDKHRPHTVGLGWSGDHSQHDGRPEAAVEQSWSSGAISQGSSGRHRKPQQAGLGWGTTCLSKQCSRSPVTLVNQPGRQENHERVFQRKAWHIPATRLSFL